MMQTRFCTACQKEKEIVDSTYREDGVRHVLSCGHGFIELNLSDSIKTYEEIKITKVGTTNERYRKGERPPNLNYAQKFLNYGDIDYKAAVILFDIQNNDYDFMNQAAFLCAQAVEKYLKAYLFWNSSQHYPNLSAKQILIEFRRLSHDLVKSLNECKKYNNDFAKLSDSISVINKYSLLKYPDIEDAMVYSTDGFTVSSDMLKDVKTIGEFVKKSINS